MSQRDRQTSQVNPEELERRRRALRESLRQRIQATTPQPPRRPEGPASGGRFMEEVRGPAPAETPAPPPPPPPSQPASRPTGPRRDLISRMVTPTAEPPSQLQGGEVSTARDPEPEPAPTPDRSRPPRPAPREGGAAQLRWMWDNRKEASGVGQRVADTALRVAEPVLDRIEERHEERQAEGRETPGFLAHLSEEVRRDPRASNVASAPFRWFREQAASDVAEGAVPELRTWLEKDRSTRASPRDRALMATQAVNTLFEVSPQMAGDLLKSMSGARWTLDTLVRGEEVRPAHEGYMWKVGETLQSLTQGGFTDTVATMAEMGAWVNHGIAGVIPFIDQGGIEDSDQWKAAQRFRALFRAWNDEALEEYGDSFLYSMIPGGLMSMGQFIAANAVTAKATPIKWMPWAVSATLAGSGGGVRAYEEAQESLSRRWEDRLGELEGQLGNSINQAEEAFAAHQELAEAGADVYERQEALERAEGLRTVVDVQRREYERLAEEGPEFDREMMLWASNLGLVPGVIQVFPVMRAWGRLSKSHPREMSRLVFALREGSKGAIEEAIVETAGQIGFNAIAQALHEEDRRLFQEIFMAGGTGAAVGFLASLTTSAIGSGTAARRGRILRETGGLAQIEQRSKEEWDALMQRAEALGDKIPEPPQLTADYAATIGTEGRSQAAPDPGVMVRGLNDLAHMVEALEEGIDDRVSPQDGTRLTRRQIKDMREVLAQVRDMQENAEAAFADMFGQDALEEVRGTLQEGRLPDWLIASVREWESARLATMVEAEAQMQDTGTMEVEGVSGPAVDGTFTQDAGLSPEVTPGELEAIQDQATEIAGPAAVGPPVAQDPEGAVPQEEGMFPVEQPPVGPEVGEALPPAEPQVGMEAPAEPGLEDGPAQATAPPAQTREEAVARVNEAPPEVREPLAAQLRQMADFAAELATLEEALALGTPDMTQAELMELAEELGAQIGQAEAQGAEDQAAMLDQQQAAIGRILQARDAYMVAAEAVVDIESQHGLQGLVTETGTVAPPFAFDPDTYQPLPGAREGFQGAGQTVATPPDIVSRGRSIHGPLFVGQANGVGDMGDVWLWEQGGDILMARRQDSPDGSFPTDPGLVRVADASFLENYQGVQWGDGAERMRRYRPGQAPHTNNLPGIAAALQAQAAAQAAGDPQMFVVARLAGAREAIQKMGPDGWVGVMDQAQNTAHGGAMLLQTEGVGDFYGDTFRAFQLDGQTVAVMIPPGDNAGVHEWLDGALPTGDADAGFNLRVVVRTADSLEGALRQLPAAEALQEALPAPGAAPDAQTAEPSQEAPAAQDEAQGPESGPQSTPQVGAEPVEGETVPHAGDPRLRVPRDVYEVRPTDMEANPQRFQYKAAEISDQASGVSDELKQIQKWDRNLAGVLLGWIDPADGKLYVVNGHHRLELAKRLGVDNLLVRVINVSSDKAARLVGALTNIAEGRGSAIDAAKVFRDHGITPGDLENRGISIRGAMARQGVALSNLADWIFNRVVQGQLSVPRAEIIGQAGLEHHQQEDLVKIMDRAEAKGRRLTNRQLEHYIRQALSSPTFQGERGSRGADAVGFQDSLFGDEVITTDLWEQAILSDYVENELVRRRRSLGSVSTEAQADRIRQAGVGDIDTARARAAKTRTEQMLEIWTALSTRGGEVNDMMRAHAKRLAEGESEATVKAEFFDAIEGYVLAEIERLTGAGREGGEGGSLGLLEDGPPLGGYTVTDVSGVPIGQTTERGAEIAYQRLMEGDDPLEIQQDLLGQGEVVAGDFQRNMFGAADFASNTMAEVEAQARRTVDKLAVAVQTGQATQDQVEAYREALALLRRAEAMSAEEVKIRLGQVRQELDPMVEDMFGQEAQAEAPAEGEQQAPPASFEGDQGMLFERGSAQRAESVRLAGIWQSATAEAQAAATETLRTEGMVAAFRGELPQGVTAELMLAARAEAVRQVRGEIQERLGSEWRQPVSLRITPETVAVLSRAPGPDGAPAEYRYTLFKEDGPLLHMQDLAGDRVLDAFLREFGVGLIQQQLDGQLSINDGTLQAWIQGDAWVEGMNRMRNTLAQEALARRRVQSDALMEDGAPYRPGPIIHPGDITLPDFHDYYTGMFGPWYYSAAQRALEDAPFPRSTITQWNNWLKKQHSISQTELDWIGLSDIEAMDPKLRLSAEDMQLIVEKMGLALNKSIYEESPRSFGEAPPEVVARFLELREALEGAQDNMHYAWREDRNGSLDSLYTELLDHHVYPLDEDGRYRDPTETLAVVRAILEGMNEGETNRLIRANNLTTALGMMMTWYNGHLPGATVAKAELPHQAKITALDPEVWGQDAADLVAADVAEVRTYIPYSEIESANLDWTPDKGHWTTAHWLDLFHGASVAGNYISQSREVFGNNNSNYSSLSPVVAAHNVLAVEVWTYLEKWSAGDQSWLDRVHDALRQIGRDQQADADTLAERRFLPYGDRGLRDYSSRSRMDSPKSAFIHMSGDQSMTRDAAGRELPPAWVSRVGQERRSLYDVEGLHHHARKALMLLSIQIMSGVQRGDATRFEEAFLSRTRGEFDASRGYVFQQKSIPGTRTAVQVSPGAGLILLASSVEGGTVIGTGKEVPFPKMGGRDSQFPLYRRANNGTINSLANDYALWGAALTEMNAQSRRMAAHAAALDNVAASYGDDLARRPITRDESDEIKGQQGDYRRWMMQGGENYTQHTFVWGQQGQLVVANDASRRSSPHFTETPAVQFNAITTERSMQVGDRELHILQLEEAQSDVAGLARNQKEMSARFVSPGEARSIAAAQMMGQEPGAKAHAYKTLNNMVHDLTQWHLARGSEDPRVTSVGRDLTGSYLRAKKPYGTDVARMGALVSSQFAVRATRLVLAELKTSADAFPGLGSDGNLWLDGRVELLPGRPHWGYSQRRVVEPAEGTLTSRLHARRLFKERDYQPGMIAGRLWVRYTGDLNRIAASDNVQMAFLRANKEAWGRTIQEVLGGGVLGETVKQEGVPPADALKAMYMYAMARQGRLRKSTFEPESIGDVMLEAIGQPYYQHSSDIANGLERIDQLARLFENGEYTRESDPAEVAEYWGEHVGSMQDVLNSYFSGGHSVGVGTLRPESLLAVPVVIDPALMGMFEDHRTFSPPPVPGRGEGGFATVSVFQGKWERPGAPVVSPPWLDSQDWQRAVARNMIWHALRNGLDGIQLIPGAFVQAKYSLDRGAYGVGLTMAGGLDHFYTIDKNESDKEGMYNAPSWSNPQKRSVDAANVPADIKQRLRDQIGTLKAYDAVYALTLDQAADAGLVPASLKQNMGYVGRDGNGLRVIVRAQRELVERDGFNAENSQLGYGPVLSSYVGVQSRAPHPDQPLFIRNTLIPVETDAEVGPWDLTGVAIEGVAEGLEVPDGAKWSLAEAPEVTRRPYEEHLVKAVAAVWTQPNGIVMEPFRMKRAGIKSVLDMKPEDVIRHQDRGGGTEINAFVSAANYKKWPIDLYHRAFPKAIDKAFREIGVNPKKIKARAVYSPDPAHQTLRLTSSVAVRQKPTMTVIGVAENTVAAFEMAKKAGIPKNDLVLEPTYSPHAAVQTVWVFPEELKGRRDQVQFQLLETNEVEYQALVPDGPAADLPTLDPGLSRQERGRAEMEGEAVAGYGSVGNHIQRAYEILEAAQGGIRVRGELDGLPANPKRVEAVLAARDRGESDQMVAAAIKWRGQRVKSLNDLYEAVWRFRSPEYEQAVFTVVDAQGKIVAQPTVTTGMIDRILLSESDVKETVELAKKMGGATIFLSHNHPSGQASPSNADMTMTDTVASQIEASSGGTIKFGGHMVTDGDHAFWIHPSEPDMAAHAVKLYMREPAGAQPEWSNLTLGRTIKNTRDLIEVVRGATAMDAPGIVFMTTRNEVLAVESLPRVVGPQTADLVKARADAYGAARIALFSPTSGGREFRGLRDLALFSSHGRRGVTTTDIVTNVASDQAKGNLNILTVTTVARERSVGQVSSRYEFREGELHNPALAPDYAKFDTGDMSAERTIVELFRAMRVPVYVDRKAAEKRKALGFYHGWHEYVVLRHSTDIETAAHELGHHIHKVIFGANQGRLSGRILAPWSDELIGVARAVGREPKGQTRIEGLAEFFTLYVTDPHRARTLAPNWHEFAVKALADKAPVVLELMDEMRLYHETWEKSEPEAKLRAKIVDKGTAFRPDIGTFWGTIRFQTLDHLHYIKEMGDELDPKQFRGRSHLEIVARTAMGSGGAGEAWLRDGQFRWGSMTRVGPGLDEILNPVTQTRKQYYAFRAWVTARRARELHARGIRSGMRNEWIDAAIKNNDSEAFREAFKGIQQWNRNLLQYMADAGVMSQERVDRIIELNQEYVPFFRARKEKESFQRLAGVDFGHVFNPVKGIKGDEGDVLDPLQSLARLAYVYTNVAARQEMNGEIIRVGMAEAGGNWIRRLDKPVDRRPVFKGEILEYFFHNIEAQKDSDMSLKDILDQLDFDALPEIMAINRPGEFFGQEDVISRLQPDGTREWFQVNEQLLETMRAIQNPLRNPMVRWLAKPAGILRAGATGTPDFAVRNLWRDQFWSTVFSDDIKVPFSHGMRGFITRFNNWRVGPGKKGGDERAALMRLTGGEFANVVDMDREWIATTAKYYVKEKVPNVLADGLQLLRIVSRASENLSRQGEWNVVMEAAKEKGYSGRMAAQLASMASREIGTDYMRRGAHPTVQAIRMIATFWSPRVQSWDKFWRDHFNPRKAPKVIASALTYITLPSILLYLMHWYDEEWHQIPQAQRDLFWIMRVPRNWVPPLFVAEREQGESGYSEAAIDYAIMQRLQPFTTTGDGDVFLRIPKPFQPGMIYGTLVERMLDYYRSDDPESLQRAIAGITGVRPTRKPRAAIDRFQEFASSELGANTIPDVPAIQPFVEVLANYNRFYDRPIIPMSQQRLSPELQYSAYTSEWAKGMAQMFNRMGAPVAPTQIDHIYSSITAGAGRYVSDAVDLGLFTAGLADRSNLPSRGWPAYPFIRSFTLSPPGFNSEVMQELRREARGAEMAWTTYRHLMEREEFDMAERHLRRNGHLVARHRELNAAVRWVNELGREADWVRDQTRLTRPARQQIIDEIARTAMEEAKRHIRGFDPTLSTAENRARTQERAEEEEALRQKQLEEFEEIRRSQQR